MPAPFKRVIRLFMKMVRYRVRLWRVRRAVKAGGAMRIIVGAAETYQAGWFSTNEQWLDITKKSDWDSVFPTKGNVTHVLAEHVFEHLTAEEAARSLSFIFELLGPMGRVRIAVPDGFNPDREYIRHVGIKGIGADASDHKQLLNKVSLQTLLSDAGFQIECLEGYDEEGKLHVRRYDAEDGFVLRSRRTTRRITAEGWHFKDAQTSLIMDGVKVR